MADMVANQYLIQRIFDKSTETNDNDDEQANVRAAGWATILEILS